MDLLISIIIPVYNVAPYLDRCLKSACSQTYDHIEIIVVDDGSTDDSPVICDAWAQNDSRIRVIHKENGGLSDARNTGLLASSGEYILYVDSDDYMELTACESLAGYTVNKPDLIAGGTYCHSLDGGVSLTQQKCFADGETVDSRTYLLLGLQHENGQCTAWQYMYRRAFLLENELFYRKGWLHEDVEIFYRLITSANRITITHHPIYHYVPRDGSISNSALTWRDLHDTMGVYRIDPGFRRKLNDPELRRYWVSSAIERYLYNCYWMRVCGWRLLGANVCYAFIHRTGFKGKLKVAYYEVKFIVHRMQGKAFMPGKELSGSLGDDYERKALVLSLYPDDATLQNVEMLEQDGYAVTLMTDLRNAEDTGRLLRDKNIRTVSVPMAGRGFRRLRADRMLRELLSNGYEIVRCMDNSSMMLAARCGKFYSESGMTVFEAWKTDCV